MLANQISEKCSPEEYWWGLHWNPQLFDFDVMTKAEEQQLYLNFSKAQHSLLHVLSVNFGTHEKQIIADHDPVVLAEKLAREYSESWDSKHPYFPPKAGWTPTTWMTTWLPFGYLCLHTIALNQDKLRNAGRKTTKETALLAGHGIKNGNNAFKNGKKNMKCGNKGCNNLVSKFRYCNPCYAAHKQKTEADEDTTALCARADSRKEAN
jgi:hypothetical protein